MAEDYAPAGLTLPARNGRQITLRNLAEQKKAMYDAQRAAFAYILEERESARQRAKIEAAVRQVLAWR